ncbi:hypothetical protein ABZ690_00070 [Streptomyces sp. NPDC006967]|uniref:hypothetical protein n=1 Tax=unclassified Streptomyces TaxID=2593676 RepID=UPI000CD563B5|nr:hypothetical protein [Streptomyces sp. SM1]
MAAKKRDAEGADGCATCDGPARETPAWDFRLDRSGLDVRAGRYLELRISLVLLLWLFAAVGGWGYVEWWQPPLS